MRILLRGNEMLDIILTVYFIGAFISFPILYFAIRRMIKRGILNNTPIPVIILASYMWFLTIPLLIKDSIKRKDG